MLLRALAEEQDNDEVEAADAWTDFCAKLDKPLTVHEEGLVEKLVAANIKPEELKYYLTWQSLKPVQTKQDFALAVFSLNHQHVERQDGPHTQTEAGRKLLEGLADAVKQLDGLEKDDAQIFIEWFRSQSPDDRDINRLISAIGSTNPLYVLRYFLRFRYWTQFTEYAEWTAKYPKEERYGQNGVYSEKDEIDPSPVHPSLFFDDTHSAHKVNALVRSVRKVFGTQAERVKWEDVPAVDGYEGIYNRYKWAKVMADRLANEFVEQVLACVENDPSALSATATSYLASDWLNKLSSITGYIRHYEPIVRRHRLWMFDREFIDDHGFITGEFDFELLKKENHRHIPDEMLGDIEIVEGNTDEEERAPWHVSVEVSVREGMQRMKCFLVRSSVLSGYMGGYGVYRILHVAHDVEDTEVLSGDFDAFDVRDGVSLIVFAEFKDGRPPEIFGKQLIERQKSR